MAPYPALGGEVPIADAFAGKGLRVIASFIFPGALVATAKTTKILLLGQTRVGFAMARDLAVLSLTARVPSAPRSSRSSPCSRSQRRST